MIKPFLPATADEIALQLGVGGFGKMGLKHVKFGGLNKNKVVKSNILFTKITEGENMVSKVEQKPAKPKAEVTLPKEKEIKVADHIPFSDFEKLDIRIGTITKIQPHPNADKLFVMMVKIFDCEPERQIVAGIRQHYKMEELLGKQIAVITNLQPVVLRGVESNGMLLAAVDGKDVAIMTPEKKVLNSAKVQ